MSETTVCLFAPARTRVLSGLKKPEGYVFKLPFVEGYRTVSSHYEYRLVKADGTYRVLDPDCPYSTSVEPVVEVWRRQQTQVGVSRTVNAIEEHLTLGEHKQNLERLKGTVPIEVDGVVVWRHQTLDQELAFEAYREGWRAVYETQWVMDGVVEFDFAEEPELPCPYIVPVRHMGEDFGSKFAGYNRLQFIKDHFTKLMTDFGYKDETESWSGPGPRGFRAKHWDSSQHELELRIGGHTLYKGRPGLCVRDTFETCLNKYEQDKAWIERDVAVYLSSLSTTVTVASLKSKLESALNRLETIVAVKASWEHKQKFRGWLLDEIARCDNLEELLRDGDNAPALSPKTGGSSA